MRLSAEVRAVPCGEIVEAGLGAARQGTERRGMEAQVSERFGKGASAHGGGSVNRRGAVRQGGVWPCMARSGSASRGFIFNWWRFRESSGHDLVGHGWARPGQAGTGKVGCGWARTLLSWWRFRESSGHGMVGLGRVRSGKNRSGMARQGFFQFTLTGDSEI